MTTTSTNSFTVPETTRALKLLGKQDIELKTVKLQQDLGPKQVLCAVYGSGICGTDVSYWQKGGIGDLIVESPLTLGHEAAGVVVKVGSNVTNVKPNDRVVIEPGHFCRRCWYCRRGQQNLCENQTYCATPPYNGALVDYFVAYCDQCTPIPDNLSWQEAACLQPLAIGMHSTALANLRAHQNILILGSGCVGLLIGGIAKA